MLLVEPGPHLDVLGPAVDGLGVRDPVPLVVACDRQDQVGRLRQVQVRVGAVAGVDDDHVGVRAGTLHERAGFLPVGWEDGSAQGGKAGYEVVPGCAAGAPVGCERKRCVFSIRQDDDPGAAPGQGAGEVEGDGGASADAAAGRGYGYGAADLVGQGADRTGQQLVGLGAFEFTGARRPAGPFRRRRGAGEARAAQGPAPHRGLARGEGAHEGAPGVPLPHGWCGLVPQRFTAGRPCRGAGPLDIGSGGADGDARGPAHQMHDQVLIGAGGRAQCGKSRDAVVGPGGQQVEQEVGEVVGVGPQDEAFHARGRRGQAERDVRRVQRAEGGVRPGEGVQHGGLEGLLLRIVGVRDEPEVHAVAAVEGERRLMALAGVLAAQPYGVAFRGHDDVVRPAARLPGPARRQTQGQVVRRTWRSPLPAGSHPWVRATRCGRWQQYLPPQR